MHCYYTRKNVSRCICDWNASLYWPFLNNPSIIFDLIYICCITYRFPTTCFNILNDYQKTWMFGINKYQYYNVCTILLHLKVSVFLFCFLKKTFTSTFFALMLHGFELNGTNPVRDAIWPYVNSLTKAGESWTEDVTGELICNLEDRSDENLFLHYNQIFMNPLIGWSAQSLVLFISF